MRLNPYLQFNGQCEAAFRFYEKVLGGKIAMIMRFAESPMAGQVPQEWREKIMHVTMTIGEQVLQASDATPDRYEKPRGFSVTVDLSSSAEAERVFKALAEKGTVTMPIQETFWALRFGMVEDQFGTPWMVNCSKPME